MTATATKKRTIDKVCRLGEAKGIGSTFVHIEYNDGRLSITGVEGPKANGDARGGSGQIVTSGLNVETYADGWDAASVAKLAELWDKWHLNDMRPGCEHQTGPDWEPRDITLFHFRLNKEAEKAKKAAEKRALASLQSGLPFLPTTEEMRIASLPGKITLPEAAPPADVARFYEANGPQYTNDNYNRASETNKTNWVNESEHPAGYLSKPCPTCGYKYGTAWRTVEVPAEVLDWLANLPEADRKPAWC